MSTYIVEALVTGKVYYEIEAESQEEKYAFSVQTISIKSTIKTLLNFVVLRLNAEKSYLVVFPVLAQNINAN